MHTTIEQVVTSDEAARKTVTHARREAKAMVEKARQEAEAMVRAGHDRLTRIERTGIRPIVMEAEQRAAEKLARAERHIQQLQHAVAERTDRILANFMDLLLDGREESSGMTGRHSPRRS